MSVLATLAGKKDSEESIGTPNAHYAPPSDGPFICMRCTHFKWIDGTVNGHCGHPDVFKDAKAGYLQLTGEKPVVHHEGCCNYFNNRYVREES